MKRRITPVTFHYMLITGGFWMGFCIVSAYAAVYLQGVGFSNAELGLILALGSVGGAVLSPVLGAQIDRRPRLRHASVVTVLLLLQAVFLVLLRIHPRNDLFTAACYVLYMTAFAPVNAMNLDLDVRLERAGAPLNFGLARSTGSLAFMVITTVLGVLTARWGFLVLPWAGLGILVLQYLGNRIIDRDLAEVEKNLPPERDASREAPASMAAFVRENRRFCLMLLGTVFLFTAHSMDGNFLINEVRHLGGDTAILGYVSAFTALVEVPVMILASRLPKRWQTVQYIRLSFVFFVFKLLAYALAPSLPFFFAARILQAPSYALYTVLGVSYTDSQVARKDSAKAQSLVFSMTTIGSVAASLLGGALFDTIGVRSTMLTATAIAAVGAAIALAGTLKSKSQGASVRSRAD